MKMAVVSSATLRDKPWSSVHHFPSEPSSKAKDLVRAVKLYRSLADDPNRRGEFDDWDALAHLMEEAVCLHVVKHSTSTDRAKRNQNQADVQYLIEQGVYEKETL